MDPEDLVAWIELIVQEIGIDIGALQRRVEVVQVTQAEYDALTPDPAKLYVVIG